MTINLLAVNNFAKGDVGRVAGHAAHQDPCTGVSIRSRCGSAGRQGWHQRLVRPEDRLTLLSLSTAVGSDEVHLDSIRSARAIILFSARALLTRSAAWRSFGSVGSAGIP